MACSRETIKKVLQYVRFRVPQTEEKNSYYTETGNTLVRISNHCTRLRVWDEILEKNPKWKGKPIISIVFEDDEDTFDEVDCLVLKRFRMKPIKVTEYVYRLQGDPQFITPQDERLIISGIKQVQGGKYTDLTNKCSEPILRVSQNPPSVPPNNQELNTEQYMDKKLIRLTESDLHKIVKESVNKILNETKKKDPMQQWLKDMDDIQKHRDNMEYITKGGIKPKHWKRTDEAYDSLGASLSDEFIEKTTEGFKRQVANLVTYMNAYSTALRDFLLGEEEFSNLYDSLAKINDNYCLD